MTDADSIYAALRTAITASAGQPGTDGPSSFDKGKVAGFIVGADEVAEATVEAYRKLGISPIFMMARESRPLYLLINKYRDVNIQGLRSVGMAQRELEDLTAKGIVLAVGATAIPTPAADFPSQQIIYDIATTLLDHAVATEASSTSDGPSNEHLVLPAKPVFLDLVDEPNSDVLAKAAEEKGWAVSRGV